MSALLPCPFCGGEGEYDNSDHAAYCWIFCKSCGAKAPGDRNHDAAIAAWNRRATPAELATLRAELAAAREALERIVGGDHPEGTSLAVNNNYRELEARLRAIARAALGGPHMTGDEAVEVMARALWRWRWRKYAAELRDKDAPDRMWANMGEDGRERYREFARAAIRALHEAGGLVLARMPDDLPMMRTPEGYALVRGHNAALAAVRAAAVEAE